MQETPWTALCHFTRLGSIHHIIWWGDNVIGATFGGSQSFEWDNQWHGLLTADS
jgi:hypothetical protein